MEKGKKPMEKAGNNSLKKNAIMNFLLNFSKLVFPLISFPYVTRRLTIDGIGNVNFYTTVGTYAVMLAGLGIGTYGIRTISLKRESKKELSICVQELFLIKLISTIIIEILLIFGYCFVPQLRQEPILFFTQVLEVFANILALDWFYSGIEQYAYVTKRAVSVRFISLALLFVLVRTKDDYIIYGILNAVTTLITIIINLIYSRRYVSYRFLGLRNYNLKQHIKPSFTLFGAILAVSIYTSLDTIMLGLICNNEAVGLYTVAVKIKSILLTFVNSISAVLFPRLSYYIEKNNTDDYKKILSKSITLILMICIPLTTFFMLEARDSILVLSGSKYLAAVPGMILLMPILLISGFSNIIGNQILLPHKMDNFFLKAVVAGAVVDFLLNLLMMPIWGYIGATLATLFAEIVQASIQIYYSKSYLRQALNYKSLAGIAISTVISGMVILGLSYFFSMASFLKLLIACAAFGVVYAVMLSVFKIEEYKILQTQVIKMIRNIVQR